MKKQISMNRINADRRFRCPANALQNTLSHLDPDFYNAGSYGWNNDTYIIQHNGETIAISTGYRNTRGEEIPYELMRASEDCAREIINANRSDYKNLRHALTGNLYYFLSLLIDGWDGTDYDKFPLF